MGSDRNILKKEVYDELCKLSEQAAGIKKSLVLLKEKHDDLLRPLLDGLERVSEERYGEYSHSHELLSEAEDFFEGTYFDTIWDAVEFYLNSFDIAEGIAFARSFSHCPGDYMERGVEGECFELEKLLDTDAYLKREEKKREEEKRIKIMNEERRLREISSQEKKRDLEEYARLKRKFEGAKSASECE